MGCFGAREHPEVETEGKLLVADGVKVLRESTHRGFQRCGAPRYETLDRQARGKLQRARRLPGVPGIHPDARLDEPRLRRRPEQLRERSGTPPRPTTTDELRTAAHETVLVIQPPALDPDLRDQSRRRMVLPVDREGRLRDL